MGIAKLYNQKQSGVDINGLIQDYYVYTGTSISAGDFVEFVNGVSGMGTAPSAEYGITSGLDNMYDNYQSIKAVLLTSTTVFVTYNGYDNHLYGVVLTVNDGVITVGTHTRIEDSTYSYDFVSVAKLSSTKLFVTFQTAVYGGFTAVICTISGTTISVGTTKQINQAKGRYASTAVLSSTKVFVVYSSGSSSGSSSQPPYGVVCTISGTTITAGTATSLVSQSASYLDAHGINSTTALVVHQYSTYYIMGYTCSVSGTTITTNSSTRLSTGTSSATLAGLSKSTLIDSSTIFLTFGYQSDYCAYGTIFTLNGTSVKKGTETLISSNKYSSYSFGHVLSGSRIVVFHNVGSTEDKDYHLYAVVCSYSGTTITPGTDVLLDNRVSSGTKVAGCLMNSSTNNMCVVHGHGTDGKYYLVSQVFRLDTTNNIVTNELPALLYETQVRKATTSDIYGVAKTAGTGGTSSGHKDTISVYRPEIYSYIDFTVCPFPKDWTTTSNTKATGYNDYGTWTVQASGADSEEYQAYYVFDGDGSTQWRRALSSDTTASTNTITLPDGVTIKPTSIYMYVNKLGDRSYISGYNPITESWETLSSDLPTGLSSMNDDRTKTIAIDTGNYYSAFRITAFRDSTFAGIYEFQIKTGNLKILC